ncbi:MAG TPA: hypothetical protein VJP77_02060, partial [Planctomycetota bacterium]|nr:hypothetical protein [Planctomycetota bacterium]
MGRGRRRAAALGIGLALLVVGDQLALRTVLADGEVAGLRVAPYPSARFFAGQDQALAELREKLARGTPTWMPFDRELGWAPRPDTVFDLYAYDSRGARVGNPESGRPGGAATLRVAAYGCSFTHGDEVDGPATWAAALERQADVRIENFGVGGYGLDQALLRMRRTLAPEATDEVWFGLLPGAALRVTTCYRPLVSPWSNALAFKPRFEPVGLDGLELVPDPVASAEEIVLLMERPELFLERMLPVDPWVARRPAAFRPLGTSPWHHSALGRLVLTWSVRRAPDPS